jgi:hypothetical protein
MALADIVRKAIKTANTVVKSFQTTVVIERWTGENVFGEEKPPTLLNAQAIVDLNPGKTFKQDGIELPIRARVYILTPIAPEGTTGRREPIDERDIFTIPGVPNARVIGTPGIQDPKTNQPYFCEVVIG